MIEAVATPECGNATPNVAQYQLMCGDCLELMKDLPDGSVDCVVTDPPYGCKNDCDYTRFTNGLAPHHNFGAGIHGDDKEFDPAPFLNFPNVVLFGYQFFAQRLPLGTILVWNKKRESQLGSFLSDCELAWQNKGHGVYLFHHVWHGFDRETERGTTLHPSQKPVALIRWCIKRVSKPGDTILDPFMGSGTTGVAAIQEGRQFIGMEIDPTYYAIAERRIADAAAQGRLF